MFPPYVLRAFQAIPAIADEHAFYGGWNSFLNTVFPISEGYIITPQLPRTVRHRERHDQLCRSADCIEEFGDGILCGGQGTKISSITVPTE